MFKPARSRSNDKRATIPGGAPLPELLNAHADFGVANVWHTGPGTYVVKLNTGSGAASLPINLSNVSITVTVENNDTTGIGTMFDGSVTKPLVTGMCGYATASQIGILAAFPSSFIVHTYPDAVGCILQDRAFFLKVVGR